MSVPKIWRKRCVRSEVLVPFSLFYFLWLRLRARFAEPEKLSVPLVCAGNVTAGGAGKTPSCLEIARLLQARGKKVAFISRGYGGSLPGPLKVDTAIHTAALVGDEPLLLARAAPCYIAKKRVEAARLAIADGAEVLVSDDGLQNLSFEKDLPLVVIDGTFGFGNGLVIPAGPLRDRLDKALSAAKAAIVIGDIPPKMMKALNKAQLPLHLAKIEPVLPPESPLKPGNYVAFAGLALPEKFFATLQKMGVKPLHAEAYPDHYAYRDKDIAELRALADKHQARLITTEKDAVRLPPEFRKEVATLPIRLRFADEEAFAALLGRYVP